MAGIINITGPRGWRFVVCMRHVTLVTSVTLTLRCFCSFVGNYNSNQWGNNASRVEWLLSCFSDEGGMVRRLMIFDRNETSTWWKLYKNTTKTFVYHYWKQLTISQFRVKTNNPKSFDWKGSNVNLTEICIWLHQIFSFNFSTLV